MWMRPSRRRKEKPTVKNTTEITSTPILAAAAAAADEHVAPKEAGSTRTTASKGRNRAAKSAMAPKAAKGARKGAPCRGRIAGGDQR